MNNLRQSSNTVLMIEPIAFSSNPLTADSNVFQHTAESDNVQELALNEFNALVRTLEEHGVEVLRVKDTLEPHTSDSIFPNNWITTHQDGNIVLYPMEATNRRLERRDDIIEMLSTDYGFKYSRIFDFSPHELSEKYLEGTGSLILDRVNKIAYACYASRTDKELLNLWAKTMGYSVCGFAAAVANGDQIYHTNVMMCLGSSYAVICLAAIIDPEERTAVVASLENTGHEIIDISEEQMFQFAGNMLELLGRNEQRLLAMSAAAHTALSQEQIDKISEHAEIVSSPIPNIEFCGGGSVRCMLAEIFLPRS